MNALVEDDAVEAAPEPVAEEKTPLDLLLDELISLKTRVAQLETSVQSHGHNLDGSAVDLIATIAVQRINESIHKRMTLTEG